MKEIVSYFELFITVGYEVSYYSDFPNKKNYVRLTVQFHF